MISQRISLSKEWHRNQFNWRARKAKGRWFAAAIRREERGRRLSFRPAVVRLLCRLLWLLCGSAAVWMSWQLLYHTIQVQEGQTEQIYEELGEEGPFELEEFWNGDGWERELFGVQIRVRDGKVTIFREKQRLVEEQK
ncbi:MAG: hypothetical protein Q4C66_11430 [Lachnospiraceae bacterium]|nr:hypothetical protein [Lachnospiraceae bacterium]